MVTIPEGMVKGPEIVLPKNVVGPAMRGSLGDVRIISRSWRA